MNNQAFEWLKQTLKTKFGKDADDITLETNLYDIGLDSLDLVELQLEYENDFSIEVPDTTREIKTVRDLIEILS